MQAAIGNSNAGLLEQLRRKYPIGSDPRWPNKRIHTSDGRSWDLNDLRLQVWAHHLVCIHGTLLLSYCQNPILDIRQVNLRPQHLIPHQQVPTSQNHNVYVPQLLVLRQLRLAHPLNQHLPELYHTLILCRHMDTRHHFLSITPLTGLTLMLRFCNTHRFTQQVQPLMSQ